MWFFFYLSTMVFSHFLILVLPLLFKCWNIARLGSKTSSFFNHHPRSLSFTQQNLTQTHILLLPKFLIPFLTFSWNSRLTYSPSTCLTTCLVGISYLIAFLVITSCSFPSFTIFLISDLTKKPRSHHGFFSITTFHPPFSTFIQSPSPVVSSVK